MATFVRILSVSLVAVHLTSCFTFSKGVEFDHSNLDAIAVSETMENDVYELLQGEPTGSGTWQINGPLGVEEGRFSIWSYCPFHFYFPYVRKGGWLLVCFNPEGVVMMKYGMFLGGKGRVVVENGLSALQFVLIPGGSMPDVWFGHMPTWYVTEGPWSPWDDGKVKISVLDPK